jgi:hypothetical protein
VKYKIPHGIAATLLIACTFWLIQTTNTRALALDVLIEKFMQAKTARYDTIATFEGQPPLKVKGFFLEPAQMREEFGDTINIYDWTARNKIFLDSKSKRATVFNLKNLPDELQTAIVMTNFEFNVELDKSLFSVEIPQGYTVADVNVDLSPPSESELITALRTCTEVSNHLCRPLCTRNQ